MNFQEKVKEFQIACGQAVGLTRGLTEEEFNFREELLKEEISELKEAIKQNDKVEIMDALCDIKYVNDGYANMIGRPQHDFHYEIYYKDVPMLLNIEDILSKLESSSVVDTLFINSYVYDLSYLHGFSLENFKTALDRVHESNMSKFCESQEVAIETQKFYKKKGIDTYTKEVGSKVVVYREADGKVLKSVNYHPVELGDLV